MALLLDSETLEGLLETRTIMGMAGRKPSDRPTVTRHKPTVDWTEVPNVSYEGWVPELPETRQVVDKSGEVIEVPVPDATRAWWDALCKMPHCVLWQESDWAFALDTAMVQAQASYGVISAMAELRMREKSLGTTVDSRRDLRIRYVEPETEQAQLAVVEQIDERRQRLLDA